MAPNCHKLHPAARDLSILPHPPWLGWLLFYMRFREILTLERISRQQETRELPGTKRDRNTAAT